MGYTGHRRRYPAADPARLSVVFVRMIARLRLRHSWTHPEGWRDWPYETPATTVTSQREGANSREMCGGPSCSSPHRDTAKTRAKEPHGCQSSGVQGVQGRVPAGGAVRVRAAASGRWRSPTTTAARSATSASCAAGSRAARRTSGATRTSCRWRAARPGPPGRLASRVGLPAGCTPLIRADRLAERAGPARGVGQERRRQPDALLQGPRRLGRRHAGPRARLPDDRVRLDRQPGELGRGPRRGARALSSYVFIPADLEEQKVLATGVYGTRLVARARATTTTSTGSAPSSRPSATGRS